jgi:hypothetical protein
LILSPRTHGESKGRRAIRERWIAPLAAA